MSLKDECAAVARVAAQMVAEQQHLSLAAWEAGGDQAGPKKDWVTVLRRAGWPTRTVEVTLPNSTRDGRAAPQPIVVVPASWLRYLARQVDVPWERACRWIVPDVAASVPRGRGRPRESPAGARPRCITMTDSEYASVQGFLAGLRQPQRENA